MMDLRDRAEWIITYVLKNSALTKKNIGDITGLTDETIAAYQKKRTDPKADFINKFCKEYNIDILWFMTGAGEPFKGASSLYPGLFTGSDGGYHSASEPDGLWGKGGTVKSGDIEYSVTVYGDDIPSGKGTPQLPGDSFALDVSSLREIYNYNDPEIIAAIHQNLKTFVRTVRREKLVSIQNKKIVDLEKRLDNIERKNIESQMEGKIINEER